MGPPLCMWVFKTKEDMGSFLGCLAKKKGGGGERCLATIKTMCSKGTGFARKLSQQACYSHPGRPLWPKILAVSPSGLRVKVWLFLFILTETTCNPRESGSTSRQLQAHDAFLWNMNLPISSLELERIWGDTSLKLHLTNGETDTWRQDGSSKITKQFVVNTGQPLALASDGILFSVSYLDLTTSRYRIQ